MHGNELRRKDLVRLDEMTDVRPREVAAGVAIAALLDRREIVLERFVPQHEPAAARQRKPVARGTRLQNTVKEVDPAEHALQKTVRTADAHEVARLVFGHVGTDRFEHVIHDGLRLADGQTADAVADEVHRRERLCAFDAQIGINAALHDAEQRLIGTRVRLLTALRPAVRAVHRPDGVRVILMRIGAFVEAHGNIRAERFFDLHDLFGREEMLAAVDVRAEHNAVLADVVDSGKAEHLEPAAVG